MHDKSGVGATVTKDTRSSASITRAWGWQRTQFHQENGYSPTENCLSYIIKEGEFTLNFFPARRGFHCISLTAKVNAPGIPSWGWGKFQRLVYYMRFYFQGKYNFVLTVIYRFRFDRVFWELRKDVFQRRMSAGSEVFSSLICLYATKFVFLKGLCHPWHMREPMKTNLKKTTRLFQVLSEILEGCFYLRRFAWKFGQNHAPRLQNCHFHFASLKKSVV